NTILFLKFCIELSDEVLTTVHHDIKLIAKLLVDESEEADKYSWV
ncbi:11259_t:CDS:1, partial [Dentiscutata erythropus]